MVKLKNLTIIGTSHIAIQSIKQVERVILSQKPSIVALELDEKRFYSLTYDKKPSMKISDIKKIGIKGFIFNLLGGWLQQKLGKIVGVLPGTEMKTAIITAKKVKADIALIDQDIEITLQKISKQLTWKEKLLFIKELLKSLIKKEERIKIDLTKVPKKSLIKKLTKKIKKDFPSLYNILIKERNEVMAKNLYHLIQNNKDKKIIAIVGAGHQDDIISIIKGEIKSNLQK